MTNCVDDSGVCRCWRGKLEAKRSDCAPVRRQEYAQPVGAHAEARRREVITRWAITMRRRPWKRCSWTSSSMRMRRPPKEIVLDLDPTDDPITTREQEGRVLPWLLRLLLLGCELYIFCGRFLLCAKLRPSNMRRGRRRRRARWRDVRRPDPGIVGLAGCDIVLPAVDGDFSTDELMNWCEAEPGVDFVSRAGRAISGCEAVLAPQMARSARHVARRPEPGDQTVQRLRLSDRTQLVSPPAGGRQGRALARARQPALCGDDRWIATGSTLKPFTSKLYCGRGDDGELRIKEQQLDMFRRTAPRRPPWLPTSSAFGSRRWPTCCSTSCAGSRSATPGLPTPAVQNHPLEAA